ncbi:hypothetical protein LX69_01349 [Breznakibacter xylanolyticus]|uniref:Uncharacterized protein n=1 Tax=Breznakibacter xylanolyticus TaxID=990 RepID=A0A2W7NEJ2_9BACT|nr:hypothetical protein LX69_01349 [Breznakibacter xylanolyticus]
MGLCDMPAIKPIQIKKRQNDIIHRTNKSNCHHSINGKQIEDNQYKKQRTTNNYQWTNADN